MDKEHSSEEKVVRIRVMSVMAVTAVYILIAVLVILPALWSIPEKYGASKVELEGWSKIGVYAFFMVLAICLIFSYYPLIKKLCGSTHSKTVDKNPERGSEE